MEQGTHTELMKLNGSYHNLVKTQDDGNVEVIEEEVETGGPENYNCNFRESRQQDDANRASFLRPSQRMRRISRESQMRNSEARMSR